MKTYVVINNINTEVDNIDWDTIDQDGINEDLLDFLGNRMVISYEGKMPPTIASIENKSQEYTKEEVILVMSDPSWAIYIDLCPDNNKEYDDHLKFYEDIL